MDSTRTQCHPSSQIETKDLTPEFYSPVIKSLSAQWCVVSECLLDSVALGLVVIDQLNLRVLQIRDSQSCWIIRPLLSALCILTRRRCSTSTWTLLLLLTLWTFRWTISPIMLIAWSWITSVCGLWTHAASHLSFFLDWTKRNSGSISLLNDSSYCKVCKESLFDWGMTTLFSACYINNFSYPET